MVNGSAAYIKAVAVHNEASAKFELARRAYRAGLVDDATYCAAFAEFKKASQAFDLAFQAEEEFAALVQIEAIPQTVKQNVLF